MIMFKLIDTLKYSFFYKFYVRHNNDGFSFLPITVWHTAYCQLLNMLSLIKKICSIPIV